ncbi:MAG: response regulator transcription factor [Bacteroidales bacterium]|jgi:DNA-binding response OmpR family regulator|nr:response regulator transcription factor [Bacteroidales bacterium]
MTKQKILLADSDWNVGPVVKSYLEDKGFIVTLLTGGNETLDNFNRKDFDFCIFDADIPQIDGIELTSRIRSSNQKTPILILSEKISEEIMVKAFEAGADDYVTKPFSMTELYLRINAILRRCVQEDADSEAIKLGIFTFNKPSRSLTYQDPVLDTQKTISITTKEAGILYLLVKNINKVVSRQELLSKAWNNETYMHARSMDVYMSRLRRILLPDPTLEILNQRSEGFVLKSKDKEIVS